LERHEENAVLRAVFNLSAQSASLRLDTMLAPPDGSPFTQARMNDDMTLELPPYGVYLGVPIDGAA
jgi:alpha-glucosidase